MNAAPFIQKYASRILAAGLFLACAPALAPACQIPVFRYALERWEAAPYEVTVLHRGALSEREQALLETLKSAAGEGLANMKVRSVDLAAPEGEGRELGAGLEGLELPVLVVRYPRASGIEPPVWTGKLTSDAIAALSDSPARRELARRLLDGESVVWILIESGDRAKDDAAFKTLEQSLKQLEKTLKLPSMEEIVKDEEYRPGTEVGLKLSFSAVRLARAGAAEGIFIAMLLGIEADLNGYSDRPIAVPVFGRGRALYGLAGDGINADTIKEACAHLTGPCSCTVKDLNPGIDLLMAVDWQRGIKEDIVQDTPLPELPGLAALAGVPPEEPRAPAAGEHSAAKSPEAESDAPAGSDSLKAPEPGPEPAGEAASASRQEAAETLQAGTLPAGTLPQAGEAAETEAGGIILPLLLTVAIGLAGVAAGTVMLRTRERSRAGKFDR